MELILSWKLKSVQNDATIAIILHVFVVAQLVQVIMMLGVLLKLRLIDVLAVVHVLQVVLMMPAIHIRMVMSINAHSVITELKKVDSPLVLQFAQQSVCISVIWMIQTAMFQKF